MLSHLNLNGLCLDFRLEKWVYLNIFLFILGTDLLKHSQMHSRLRPSAHCCNFGLAFPSINISRETCMSPSTTSSIAQWETWWKKDQTGYFHPSQTSTPFCSTRGKWKRRCTSLCNVIAELRGQLRLLGAHPGRLNIPNFSHLSGREMVFTFKQLHKCKQHQELI